MKETYQMHQDELLKQMNADPGGLSSEEAARRLQEYGENALEEQARKKGYQVFLEQFTDFLVIILIIAAIISLISGNVENHRYHCRTHSERGPGNRTVSEGGEVSGSA